MNWAPVLIVAICGATLASIVWAFCWAAVNLDAKSNKKDTNPS